MTCSVCGREGRPVHTFTMSGIVAQCPHEDCRAILHKIQEEPAGQQETRPIESIVPAKEKAIKGHEKPRVAPITSRPINVVAEAKRRLRQVEKELRVKARLEKERDELRRLIAAAEARPAPVRAVRTA